MPAIEGEQARIHYKLSGAAEGQVLVLANSIGSDMRIWDRVLPAFERHYRVLRYDMPGHGGSSPARERYSIERLGEDLVLLLDELRFDRVNLCGLSLGGLVAMWMGIHVPDRVRRVVLANTAAHIGTSEGWEQRIAAVNSSGMGPIAHAAIDRWFTPGYRDQHMEEMAFIRDMIASTDASSYAACCGVLRDTDLRSEARAIEAPSLVITGTHDPAVPPSEGHALYAALRGSYYVELDASHLSAWECHDRFAAEVLSFLAREENRHG